MHHRNCQHIKRLIKQVKLALFGSKMVTFFRLYFIFSCYYYDKNLYGVQLQQSHCKCDQHDQLPPNVALMVTRGRHITRMSCQYSVHAAASELKHCKFPVYPQYKTYAFAWLTGRHVTMKIRTGPWNTDGILCLIQLYHEDIINEDELQEILMDLLEIAWCMNN